MRLLNVSILTAGFIGLTLLPLSNAEAGSSKWHNSDYSGCSLNSGSSNTDLCESALGENIYDLVDDGVQSGTDPFNSNITVGGVNISVSAWSDTYGNKDDIVVDAKLEKISDYYGYGVTNDDWETYYNPDHAIDNVNKVNGNVTDFDFVLLSFDQAVTVSGASFSWIYSNSDSQVSVAALDSISGLTSGSQTWNDIVADALTTASYDIENCDYVEHRADFEISDTSQYWLIGAYNTVFGNIGGYVGNDAFKLSSVGFSIANENPPAPSTEVSEPTTLGLLLAGVFVVAWRRKNTQRST
ncbi:exosortase-dependent surface protein XDP1 [Alteromonas stellipolaris]|uniref:exosortase-dependent surface protein XDP1 n=1 Tax=Alteromonas stellipolaris TaxID=233316 RepID=UPI0027360148|nr:exosortase-dependent surface protein XDP1 [Alteromonas stellipolaris]MDP2534304.1 exosortase-dependent surface protein XDP1 [Alteromonas stellipolaris]